MKTNNIALIALLSISSINPMQNAEQQNKELKLILEDAENRLQREEKKSNNPNNQTVIRNKTKFASSRDSGNSLLPVPSSGIQTDKDFFERRIQLIKALKKASQIPLINFEDEKKFSQVALNMIDAIIDIGNSIVGISHKNKHLQQEDLSPFIIALMKQHPLLVQKSSPLLRIPSKISLDKFKGKYNRFESACKAINMVIPAFPTPQAIKDHHFLNLLDSINSFQGARDFNNQRFIQIINQSFPEDIEIFGGFRKDLLNAISQKNKALASEREKLREPLYSKQKMLMEQIQDNTNQISLNNIKQEIDKYFPAGNPNWQDLRESLLDVLSAQLAAIDSNEQRKLSEQQKIAEQQKLIEEQKKIEEQKNDGRQKVVSPPIVRAHAKPETPQKLEDTNKSIIQPQPQTDKKPNDPVQSIQTQNKPLKKESVISPVKVALFTSLGFAGCLLLYLLYSQAFRAA